MPRVSLSGIPWRSVLAVALFFIIGAGAGYAFGTYTGASSITVTNVRNQGPYKLIDPTLYTNVSQSLSFPEYTPLKNDITSAIQQAENNQSASDVGVYFRDLNEGHWVGVNESEEFAPGSLLKVALLMTVLQAADTNPGLLTTTVNVDFGSSYAPSAQSYFPPKDPIMNGPYTVNSLLSHLIIDSDDRAVDVLEKVVGAEALSQTLSDLQVPEPSSTSTEPTDTDTPQEFSHLFRVLYNGSYLSPSLSEQALSLLSLTEYTDGLVAGVPSGTTVAHKFGESFVTSTTTGATIDELHDCGIVYFPEHPYFLCVMTKGTDYPTLATVIANICKITWTDVSKRYQ